MELTYKFLIESTKGISTEEKAAFKHSVSQKKALRSQRDHMFIAQNQPRPRCDPERGRIGLLFNWYL